METITHDGTVFTKATVLAKKYRYTTDYIGQLCRAGKVESKLVGRAWFVNENTLVQHKSERYASIRPNEIIIHTSVFSEKAESHHNRVSVMPVLSKNTHRSIGLSSNYTAAPVQDKVLPVSVSTYHSDAGDLKPTPQSHKIVSIKPVIPDTPAVREEVSKNIPISLGEKAKHDLTFEPLPEVYLQGTLAVQSLDDADLYTETQPVSVADIQFTPKTMVNAVSNAPQTAQLQLKAVKASLAHDHHQHAPVSRVSAHPARDVKQKRAEITTPVEPKTHVSFLAVPGFVLGALFLCVGLFGLSSFAESDGLEFRESLKFNLAAVSEVFEKLPKSY